MYREKSSNINISPNFRPSVRINIHNLGGETKLYIQGDLGMVAGPYTIDMTDHDVHELNLALRQAIEAVDLDVDYEDAVEYKHYQDLLQKLAAKGDFAFKRIFKEPGLRDALSNALRKGVIIQVTSPQSFMLPWELLYVGSLNTPIDLSLFWGMQYIISRSVYSRAQANQFPYPEIFVSDKPNIGLVTNRDLEFVVSREIPYFEKLQENGSIDLITLRPLDAADVFDELQFIGKFLSRKMHIVHAACHAYEEVPVIESYLLVSEQFPIKIQDFDNGNFDLKSNPFVVLNACVTGTMSPLHTSNWAVLFWERGARGVLATEFHVPDSFASDFTEEMYKHLLAEKTVGESLLMTRRYFRNKGNPLGLAYALYGSPSIRLTSEEIINEWD